MKSKWLSRAVSVLVVGFVALSVTEVSRRLLRGDFAVSFRWVLAAAGCISLGYVALAWGLMRLIRRASPAAPWQICGEIYFRSLLARYVPGKVGVPAVRMAQAASVGATPAFMAATTVIESLAWLSTGALFVVVLTLGPWSPDMLRALWAEPWAKLLVFGAAATAIALVSVNIRRYPTWFLERLGLGLTQGALLPKDLVVAHAIYWSANGVSCAFGAWAVGGATGVLLLAATAGIAAPLAGFLALPVPAGLGIREAFLTLVLASSMGESRALGFALITRATALTCELLLWVASFGARYAYERRAHT